MKQQQESNMEKWLDRIGAGVAIIAFLVMFGLAIWIVVWFVFGLVNAPCKETIVETRIYSLILSDKIDGEFILGIGGFNAQKSYYAFEQQQGGKLLQQYPATRTVIIESDTVPVYRKYYSSLNCKQKFDELVVPPGTVKVQYNVDINN